MRLLHRFEKKCRIVKLGGHDFYGGEYTKCQKCLNKEGHFSIQISKNKQKPFAGDEKGHCSFKYCLKGLSGTCHIITV